MTMHPVYLSEALSSLRARAGSDETSSTLGPGAEHEARSPPSSTCTSPVEGASTSSSSLAARRAKAAALSAAEDVVWSCYYVTPSVGGQGARVSVCACVCVSVCACVRVSLLLRFLL
jgi:hypothetical protein